MRYDGYVFSHYCKKQGEVWRSPEGNHRQCISRTFTKAKARAASEGASFDLDIEYLHSIYPEDGRCPILGIEFEWGQKSGRNNSPSLDRKDPTKGYIKGNVAFISNRANRIKSDATKEELVRILEYMSQ